MLGLSNTLTASSTPLSSGPIELASYTSDFSTASKDGWGYNASNEVTITSNNDAVGGKDDVLKYEFLQDVSTTRSITRVSTLESGGIVAGDTIEVSFDYRVERSGSDTSGIIFAVRPGGYAPTRNHNVNVLFPFFNQWRTVTHTFENPAAVANDDFFISFASAASRPKNEDAIYFKNFVITHKGLPR